MATKPLSKKLMPCNKPRATPQHPKKSHVVKACESGREKIIRFGEQGKKVGTVSGTAGKPKAGESDTMKAVTPQGCKHDEASVFPRTFCCAV